MAAKRSAKRRKATKPWPYGVTYWIWFGTRRKGQWCQVDLGGGCKRGGKVMNPNKLKIKGKKLFQLMAVHCKAPQPDRLSDPCSGTNCCCTFTLENGMWVVTENDCGTCGGNCECTDPGAMPQTFTVVSATGGVETCCKTFCHTPP
jgi:hypothetical protein